MEKGHYSLQRAVSLACSLVEIKVFYGTSVPYVIFLLFNIVSYIISWKTMSQIELLLKFAPQNLQNEQTLLCLSLIIITTVVVYFFLLMEDMLCIDARTLLSQLQLHF